MMRQTTVVAGTGHVPEPPRLPGGLPGLGHALAFLRDPVRFLREAQETQGGPFTFGLLGRKAVFFCGPEANAAVLGAADSVLDRAIAYRTMNQILGAGVVFDVPPEVMAQHLAMGLPAVLARPAMSDHATIMLREVHEYCSTWGRSGVVDLRTAMHELSVRIAARCIGGPAFASRMRDRLPRLLRDLQAALMPGLLLNPELPLPVFRRRDRARERILSAIKDSAESTGERSFFTYLINAKCPDGSRLDEDIAARLTLGTIFAATETTASHAVWAGVLLLRHPEWLPVVREEQQRVFAGEQPATSQPLRRLVRLHDCVMEAERLRPAIKLLLRTAVADFHYGGYRVPPGRLVLVSPAVSHRLPHLFAEPDRFDPDRYRPGREEHRTRPGPLIGFGGGHHTCAGLAFAYQEIKAIWSVLIRSFDLELVDPEVHENRFSFLSEPRGPCLVRYRRRNNEAIPSLGAVAV
jgi:sterol 14-demethylase